MASYQTTQAMRAELERAITEGSRATIQYLDSLRLVTPLAIRDGMLIAEDHTGGDRYRSFNLDMIREALAVAADATTEDVGLVSTRFELRMPTALLARVDEAARRGGTSRAAIIREALQHYLPTILSRDM